jgi:signal transduction histidine kinase/ActR/RegA family two-component response regulator
MAFRLKGVPSVQKILLALAVCFPFALLLVVYSLPARVPDRVYRIGVDSNPPLSEILPNGRPVGLAVELISEAARRRHIRLDWVSTKVTFDEAVKSGGIDIWPITGITEARRRSFHLTEPWFFNAFCLIERQEARNWLPGEVAGKKVAITGFPLATVLARQYLPKARLVTEDSRAGVLEAVCSGETAAAFEEASYTNMMMLNRPAGCAGVALKINLVKGAVANGAIGSTYAAAAVADALRDEIGKLAVDGTMAASLERWSSFSANETKSVLAMQATEQQRRILLYGLMGAVLASLCLLWQVRRISSAKKTAEQASLVKSEFLANMSHEIRTPMNGVLGLLDLVLDGEITPACRKDLVIARQSGHSLLAILNDILDLSAVEAGKFRIERSVFNLRNTLQELVEFFRPRCAEKGLQIHLDYPMSLPHSFYGDQRRIRQIATNFAGNAFKFTDRGSIAIVVECEETWASEQTRSSELMLRISVTDTGIGIPAEERHRLFQKFTQLDGSASRRHGGTGLGLAISRQIAEMLGGSVGVESGPGGSTFWVALPIEPRPDPEYPQLPLSASGAVQERHGEQSGESIPRRILIAEDNKVNQHVLTRSLQKLGYAVDVAANGLEAVERWESADYDAILMDCQMPEMDGYEATRTIRGYKNRQSGLPIIALTAHAMAGDEERCKTAGMDAYLSKPLILADLERVLNEYAPNRNC